MRTDAELEALARQLADLDTITDPEAARRFHATCADRTGAESRRLGAIAYRLGEEHGRRADALEHPGPIETIKTPDDPLAARAGSRPVGDRGPYGAPHRGSGPGGGPVDHGK